MLRRDRLRGIERVAGQDVGLDSQRQADRSSSDRSRDVALMVL